MTGEIEQDQLNEDHSPKTIHSKKTGQLREAFLVMDLWTIGLVRNKML